MGPPLRLELVRAVPQPAAPVPPVFCTRGAMQALQGVGDRMAAFLDDTNNDLSQVVSGGSTHPRPIIIHATVAEFPSVALAQGWRPDQKVRACGALLGKVLHGETHDWPEPVGRVGRWMHAAAPTVPWIVSLLPASLDLQLNGVVQHGMTHSPLYNAMYDDAVDAPEKLVHHEGPERSTPFVSSYLSGQLWVGPKPLLPLKVMLHEASHVAHIALLRDWMFRNAVRDVGMRNPAFVRHCRLADAGEWKIDFAFATLFFELAAYLATGAFFETIHRKSENGDTCSMMMACHAGARMYLMAPRFAIVRDQAGLPPVNRGTSLREMVSIMQQFVGMVCDDIG